MIKSVSRVTASLLGLYAGLLGAAHGVYEVLQGSVAPDGVLIYAVGPPCQPETAAHACLPAMTLVPNFLVTGILAIVLSLAAALWAVGFVHRRYGGLVLVLLSVGMLLVGSGFVPMFVSVAAGAVAMGMHASASRLRASWVEKPLRLLARLWLWPLVAYFLWVFPVQRLLERFWGAVLLEGGLGLFLLFDIGLPWLAALTAFAYDKVKGWSNEGIGGL